MLWEFEPERLEEAVEQLVGQTILVCGGPERRGDEIVSFQVRHVYHTYLDVRNRLTRETATSLLHFLYHLGSGVYINRLWTFLWHSEHSQVTPDISRTRMNPTIFHALRKARSGRVLRIYTNWKHTGRQSLFEGEEGPELAVRIHCKYTYP